MLIAGRMLQKKSQHIGFTGTPAKLVAAVVYRRWDGMEVSIDAGTAILVDVTKGIATTTDENDPDHFCIEVDEYSVLFN